MNSKQLFYFVSVAETGSFTAAAQKLGLSQPPLSKQIMLLEEELGVMLLKRGSRKAELTEEGTYLYGQAKNILSMMDTTAQELSHFHGGQNGVLRLGTISSSGYILTEQILKNFCQEFPRIRFELNEGNTYELLEQLKNGIIECAILRTPFNSEGFECIYGPEEPLAAVGKPRFFHGEGAAIILPNRYFRVCSALRSFRDEQLFHIDLVSPGSAQIHRAHRPSTRAYQPSVL